ncbi:6-hydroxy-D-nicotine oxidase [Naviculisporaceae sp. PSN 640]
MKNTLPLFLVGGSLLVSGTIAAGPPGQPLVPFTWEGKSYGCKCYPGDACWPSQKEWNKLNSIVSGNLAVIVPPEAACHNSFTGLLGTIPTYDAAKCADVTANYPFESWINDQDATLMWKLPTNSSCLLTTDPTTPCSSGYYGTYVIRAKTKQHIKAGLEFATKHNLRIIVRNTGHDFLGRSTGWGALIINTHSFQDVQFHKSWKPAKKGGYTGSAVTIAAGVQGRALLRQAVAQDPPVTLVVGECPTVGVAGGFVQGGGHGMLTTTHGFAADNALAFEVLTEDGKFLTADDKNNPDLFYALKGGGPGNYAIVLSVSFKTFPERPSAGATLYLNNTLTTNATVFWEGVRIFHSFANDFVDAGLYVLFTIAPGAPGSLRVKPFVAYNQTAAQLEATLTPLKTALTAAGVPFYASPTKQYDTLTSLYIDLFDDETAGPPFRTSGWMIARQDITTNNNGIVSAFQTALSPREDLVNQGYLVGHLFGPGHNTAIPAGISATHPNFRHASNLMLYNLPVSVDATLAQKEDIKNVMVNTIDKAMKDASPNGCGYVNEADPVREDFAEDFWGDEVYPRLKQLKKKWDSKGTFYAVSLPGTEDWEVVDYGRRLCKRL